MLAHSLLNISVLAANHCGSQSERSALHAGQSKKIFQPQQTQLLAQRNNHGQQWQQGLSVKAQKSSPQKALTPCYGFYEMKPLPVPCF
jgi:hypothetical protein